MQLGNLLIFIMTLFYCMCFVMIFGVLPLLYFFIAKRKFASKLKAILPFLVLVFVASIYEIIFTVLLRWQVNYWLIIHDVCSFFCVYFFYSTILEKKYYLLLSIFLFCFLLLIFFLFANYSINDFPSIVNYITMYTTVFILFFTALWFVKIIKEGQIEDLLSESTFYFITGFILYHCGTLFTVILAEYIFTYHSSILKMYTINMIIFVLTLRTLLLVGLWKVRVN